MYHDKIDIGIVADWLVTFAGAEKVIKEFFSIYPDADLYSVVDFLSEESRENFNGNHAKTTFIQGLPKAKRNYQKYLPFMPLAIEQLDVSQHNVILSSNHAVAKGVLTGPDQLHICYIHSPIRYAWDLQHQYLRESGLNRGIKGTLAKWILHKIRMWDYRTANGVDHFVANSQFIARRVKKVYGRHADVIYPPVDVERFNFQSDKDDYYITASRLVPYKRVDLIVEAFTAMPDKKLVVIGDGSEIDKIKSKAGKNIEILGYQSNEILQKYMEKAKAFVFAAEEDFGITPVEAQACGTPVIAYGKGGSLETVRPYGVTNPTGVFFDEQTASSLNDAVLKFETIKDQILSVDCRNHAVKFSSERFRNEMADYIESKWNAFNLEKAIVY
ncbi:glycosyltransferase family 4 protein [Serratia liquefaciens]|jgi:glycosyltransferase involved in cell wall biosynthesis|uniref:glycosyltransferase family 4 protein n=1 Tax=Serratia liquefaciens TaxID=614 RepID=UPI000DFE9886|nr:glycosyltransferase family 4 protein [Serratia liquefaciens]MBF8104349.1 glycosyltransferase family 4 protein [Serratia liquefaciens]RYM87459.1 glycosyl transferase family 1 [Serratia liquefaciens]CAB1212567.1 GDP-mannose-dependent alpha-(1-6)-phosphatidylinositol monomannoside mannosyltransferase [Serratia liquefaciens]CAI1728021.1 GDP-mannose-dependent alpha-(1-6)-phosphatidylinositol monomannoside mannosyltransferase [Serratia liquefaciens]CAI1748859.1 GDP-mannose-dependent alpha-(1-6)-p